MFGGRGVLMWRGSSKDKIPEQDSIIILPVNIKARLDNNLHSFSLINYKQNYPTKLNQKR